MRVGLKIERLNGETWRDAAARYGRMHGLEAEVLAAFDYDVSVGTQEPDAAYSACYEWDVCDVWRGED